MSCMTLLLQGNFLEPSRTSPLYTGGPELFHLHPEKGLTICTFFYLGKPQKKFLMAAEAKRLRLFFFTKY